MSYQRLFPILVRLCTLLIEDQYGDSASRLFAVLARNGRQSFRTLTQKAKDAHMKGPAIKHGLVVLIQQHLVYHTADHGTGETFYEVNIKQAYFLVRFGKMVSMAESRFGKKAAALMSNLSSFGHTTVGDIEDAYFPTEVRENGTEDDALDAKKRKTVNGSTNGSQSKEDPDADGVVILNGVSQKNGKAVPTGSENTSANATKINSREELHAILYALLDASWLISVTETDYMSPSEIELEARTQVKQELFHGKQPVTAKDEDRLEQETIRRMREMRDQAREIPPGKIKFDALPANRKRSAEDLSDTSSKRTKGANGAANPISSDSKEPGILMPEFTQAVTIDRDVVVRVNHDKLTVALRSEHLIALAEARYQKTTSLVYRALVQHFEKSEPRCYEEYPDSPIPPRIQTEFNIDPRYTATSNDILKLLDPRVDLLDGLEPQIAHSLLDNPPDLDENKQFVHKVDPQTLTRGERLKFINKHLHFLSSDSNTPFISWVANHSGGTYRIEYDLLARQIIQKEIDLFIMARVGNLGLSLIRILRKKGKLNEQEICKLMCTTPDIVRRIIPELQVLGYLQTTEVPKVDSRVTKYSEHFVWFDGEMARERLLVDTYKSMCRCVERVKGEMRGYEGVMRKAGRRDVVGNEERYLSKGERGALRRVREVEGLMVVGLGRMDELVAVLRDFTGNLPIEFPIDYRPKTEQEKQKEEAEMMDVDMDY